MYVYVKNWQLPNEFNTKNFMQYNPIHEHCTICNILFIYFVPLLCLFLYFSINHLLIHNNKTIDAVTTVSNINHFYNSITPLFIYLIHSMSPHNKILALTTINKNTTYKLNLNIFTATIPRHSVKSKNYCMSLLIKYNKIGERKINCGGYK